MLAGQELGFLRGEFLFGQNAGLLELAELLQLGDLLIRQRTRRGRRWGGGCPLRLHGLLVSHGLVIAGLLLGRSLLLCGGLLLAGYWNVRNWILTGNPFYPYEVTVGGAPVFSTGERTARLEFARLSGNLENLASKFGDKQDPIRPDLPNTTG